MYQKGKKSQVGLEICEYCRKNGLTIGDFCIKIGVPTHKVDSILYGRQVRVLPEVAERFAEFGFDLSKEFTIAAHKSEHRLIVYPDRLTKEQLDDILRIIGRR